MTQECGSSLEASDSFDGQVTSKPRSSLAWGALLFGLVVVVYLPSFCCGFIWDDDDYLIENSAVQAWNGLPRIWFDVSATPQYYPLVHSSFWLEFRLWGLDPAGYHVVNVLLHATSTVVLWRILASLRLPGAWLAAAVFGVHPVHVESVAWVTERKNVLSGLCYVSALKLILPILGVAGFFPTKKAFTARYLIGTCFFIGALLSKSVTCSLPAVCLLVVYWQHGQIRICDIVKMLPWFVFGLVAALQTAWLERNHVGASGIGFQWTAIERCWIAGNAVWFYLEKLIWPYPLVFFYPRWTVTVDRWADWIGPITAILAPVIFLVGQKQFGRGPLVASLFYGGTLLPALGFVNVYPMRYSFVADHFQYLASLGPIVLAIAITSWYLNRVPIGSVGKLIACGLILTPLCVTTWMREAVYRDIESLWTDVLTKNPNCFAAHFHLGKVRTAQGRHADATGHFREALRLRTDDLETHITLILLGNSLARQGQFDEAETCLNEALERHPDDWEAIHGLATLAGRRQQHPRAIELYERIITLKPDEPVVHLNLGNALAITGDLVRAATEYTTALRLRPGLVDATVNLANLYARQNRLPEAEQLYVDALARDPNHAQARSNLARVRASIQKAKQANP